MIAVLTADMQDFSARLKADEQALIEWLTSVYYRLAEEMVQRFQGNLFRREGDAIWCRFALPDLALQGGAWLLQQMNLYNAHRPLQEQVQLRVGIHYGMDNTQTLQEAKLLESGGRVGCLHVSEALRCRVSRQLAFEKSDHPQSGYWVQPEAFAFELEPSSLAKSPASPYKFLNAYGPDDSSIFCGRTQELETLRRRLQGGVFVLYGKSGVGKSSLLRAGLQATTRQKVIAVRLLSDPLSLICKAVRQELSQPEAETRQLDAYQGWLQLQQENPEGCLLLLDQFEEVFIRCTREQRRELARLLAQLDGQSSHRSHIVISLREDFLAEMSELEVEFPQILRRRMRLTALTREQALECMVKPASLFGVSLEESLLSELLSVLQSEGFHPPELQIVLERLYRERNSEQRMTLASYQQLGGASAILGGYLDETLRDHLGPDAERARRVLKAMLSERNTKTVVTAEQLLQKLSFPAETLQPVLRLLIDSRLVRVIRDETTPAYELAHETLVDKVSSWQHPKELAHQHAQLTLKNEMRNYKRVASLMPLDRLKMLADPELGLLPDEEERAMLVRASLLHQVDPDIWLDAPQHGQEILPTLLAMLQDCNLEDDIRRRILVLLAPMTLESRALDALAAVTVQLGNPTLLRQLPQGKPGVRELLERATWERYFASMVEVPEGGCYLGSSPECKAQRKAVLRSDLHPRIDSEMDYHWREVAGFFIDPWVVSNARYAEFAPMHRHFFASDEGEFPAVNVSYEEATAYAQWLGKRLPNELEWEKAARGSSGWLFPWGNHFEGQRVNSAESGRRSPIPVYALPEGGSLYGCLNMAGNVWEWTSTPWLPDSPLMAKKGGCALNFEPLMHCSARFEDPPEMRLRWAGFRLVSDRRKAGWS